MPALPTQAGTAPVSPDFPKFVLGKMHLGALDYCHSLVEHLATKRSSSFDQHPDLKYSLPPVIGARGSQCLRIRQTV